MSKRVISEKPNRLPSDFLRVKEVGNIIELVHSRNGYSGSNCIEKLDSEHYLDLRTGEVKEFVHMESRADDMKSVRASLGRLRDIINANVIDPANCLWVTLTYKENMTDTKRLYKDYEKYIKRMMYRGYEFKYIVAMEPQGRGAWHAHVIFIFPEKAPYIPNEEMRAMWGHGFVVVRSLKDVDNVGAYLTAYLGDMELQEAVDAGILFDGHERVKQIEVEDEAGRKQTKAYVKGARLCMYPPKFNLYRCSRGIKKPDVSYTTEQEAKKMVGDAALTYERVIEISDDNAGYENILHYRCYNKVRKQNPEEGKPDDASSSNRGVHNRPAGTWQFVKDCPVLQANTRTLCKIYRAIPCSRIDSYAVQEVYYPAEPDWDCLDNGAILCSCVEGVPEMGFQ